MGYDVPMKKMSGKKHEMMEGPKERMKEYGSSKAGMKKKAAKKMAAKKKK
jgi:hypothetical protein